MKPFIIVVGLLLVFFSIMNYWSLLVQEEGIIHLQNDVRKLTLHQAEAYTPTKSANTDSLKEEDKTVAQTNPDNLLQPDPFMVKTLPKLLGPNFKPTGIRTEATIGRPDTLNIFSNWVNIMEWLGLCTAPLSVSEVGRYETTCPAAAVSMVVKYNEQQEPEYWLELRRDLFWEPLQPNHFASDLKLAPSFLTSRPVTAHDYVFYLDAAMNPHMDQLGAVALRTNFSDLEEWRAVDDYTLVVKWKPYIVSTPNGGHEKRAKYLAKTMTASLIPLARFVYQHFADGSKIISDDQAPHAYRDSKIWAQNFAHHWANNVFVSCGPYLFDGLTERGIRFKRNPRYFEPLAALSEGYDYSFKDSQDAIWDEFKSGKLDLYLVQPHQLSELERYLSSLHYKDIEKQGLGVRKLVYLNRSYSYIGWNEANPLFANFRIRQALTMAIDRERIIQQNLNGMAIQTTGTFFPYSPSYDPSIKPWPYDPEAALRILHEEGWYDSTGEGFLSKKIDGKAMPFEFSLTYFVKNPTTKANCETIATSLRKIGIVCHLRGVDVADLSRTLLDKSFDAIYMAWYLGTPPEDPKQIWDSAGAKEPGSSNTIGFANAEVDAIIQELQYEDDPQKRIELYHRFDAILHEQAPYTFLYTPKYMLIYRDYLQNVFIPAERKDLFPNGNVGEPVPSIYWIKEH